MKVQKETLEGVQKGMLRFIRRVFLFGVVLGITASVTYSYFGTSKDKFFHGFILLAGIGFTAPMFMISVRLMLKMFFMSYEQMENQNDLIEDLRNAKEQAGPIIEKVEKVVDKSVPIAENVEKVVQRAAGMADDIEKIAHKIRQTTDAMNGSLNAKTLEEVRDSLKKIADAFTGWKMPTEADFQIPEFDPLKARPRRHKEPTAGV